RRPGPRRGGGARPRDRRRRPASGRRHPAGSPRPRDPGRRHLRHGHEVRRQRAVPGPGGSRPGPGGPARGGRGAGLRGARVRRGGPGRLLRHRDRGPRAQRGQHHAGHDGALTGAPDVRRSGVQLREPARRAGPGGRVTGPRNPALDLLRGLAVGLVLLRHALPAVFPGAGVVGIVMFLALRGYLLTRLLTADLRVHGRVRFARFYRRRALRLAPPLLVLVIVVAVVMMTLDPLGDRSETLRTVAIALTWTANLPLDQGSAATFHLWTLAT